MAKWDGIPATLQRWRVDPFTGTPQYITKTVYETEDLEGLTHTVREAPFNWASKPYIIMAQEATYNDGAVELQYDDGGGWTDGVEVDFDPEAEGQYQVEHKFLTGLIRFHSSMDGYTVRLKYTGMGHVVNQEVLYNLFVQDSQYGHEWMAWDEETHPTKEVDVFYDFDYFNWYSFIVNPAHGTFGHWPVMKATYNDGSGNLAQSSECLVLPLFGGYSVAPSIGYTFVGGTFVTSSVTTAKKFDVNLQINIHDS